ncbi:MAG: hypothetical protein J6N49_07145, partial [Alphaproteobacteria bacterium]|nr:hypothetical protein [Alphaproteobacteria bacterium]
GEWEYVDENGNPVEGGDGEWEYVDENGNPIEGGDGEWEYVDENGNPIEGGDGSNTQESNKEQDKADTQSLMDAFNN